MLDTTKVTRALIVKEGHVEPRSIELDEIYVPKHDTSSGNNVTRYELDMKNVANLQVALHFPNWSLTLMIVKEIKGGKEIDGKTYYYELVAGFHRFEALSMNQVKEWLFDVYDFTGKPEVESDIQALENDHPPAKQMDKFGLANWLKYNVEKGFIERTEAAMHKKVEMFKFVPSQTKTAAVNMAVNETDAYKDVTIRSITEIKQFLDNDDNYRDDNRPKYQHSGTYDSKRNEYGWTVKQDYEHEYLFNAIRKYEETQIPSYFVCHVKVPKSGTVDEARNKMLKKFSALEDALSSAVNFRGYTLPKENKDKTWPWRVETFFKQDNHPDRRETYWIDK